MEVKKQIPEGYKLTEVGVIPVEWEVKKFEKITNTITCGVAATPKYVRSFEGRPFLSAQNVQKGSVLGTPLKFIPVSLYESLIKHNKPERGDILYTRVGAGIGEAAVIELDFDFAIYVSLTLIKPKNHIDSYFLTHLLNSDFYKDLAKRDQFAGGGVQNLNVQVVREFPIPVPTLTEQTAIANALSDADALIAALDELIVKKRQIKQGTMQQLLTPPHRGGRRLEGFSGAWEEITLGTSSVLKARIGWQGLTTSEYLKQGDYFLVTGTDFKDGLIDWNNCHFVEFERYAQDRNIQLKVKDVLVTKDGTIGKVAIIRKLPKPATLNSGVFVIRPKNNEYLSEFLYWILMSEHFKEFLNQLTAGSTISHLYQKDFIHFNFFLPSTKAEQTAITTILSDMDAEIESLKSKRAKYQAIKQGMMQELLTGRVRLI